MADSSDTLASLALELAKLLEPLENRLDPAQVLDLLVELGIQFPPALVAQASFTNALNQCQTSVAALPTLITQLVSAIEAENVAQMLSLATQTIQKTSEAIAGFDTIATELQSVAGALPGLNSADVVTFAGQLAEGLLDYLLVTYLEDYYPRLLAFARFFGVVEITTENDGSTEPGHPPYSRRRLKLDHIPTLFTSFREYLNSEYGWGSNTFDGQVLLSRVRDVLYAFTVPAQLKAATATQPLTLRVLLFSIVPKSTLNPPGLELMQQYSLAEDFSVQFPFFLKDWSIQIEAKGSIQEGLALDITPPSTLALKPPNGSFSGEFWARLLTDAGSASHVLVGQAGGSRIEAASIGLGLGSSFSWESSTASGDLIFEGKVTKGKIVLSLAGADSFLTSLFPPEGFALDFDFTFGWSDSRGFYFSGGAALEIDIPLHLSLGPVTLDTLYLRLSVSGDGLKLETSLAAGGELGPVAVVVDRIGIQTDLGFKRGNLGPADLSIAFKPPNGLGIAIDAGVVAGGGYILFDSDKGQYAGVLDVALAEIIQVKIIGVLDTILPDGSHGFSFLLIITFDFPPIQLSFGFTLNGVGGLGGVNRTMNTDALHTGFRTHTLDTIMFPSDPIANAPQIISNIENFFPPAEGRYLFGPMLKIGWGTPTLITLTVGVILEVPDPIRIVLLGLIAAGLPSTEVALIDLHIDVLGILDFGKKTLSIDGSLYDSHVLIFSVAGDLALRLSWGDDPNFVFSLGGFNPHFNTTGLDVPAMHRLSVSIGDGDNPRISANSYYAITSNTVQFGANVEAYAEAGGFSIHGYLGFDVLFIISPFSFEFDFSAGFDVSFEDVGLFGLNVHGTFSGPRPWHLNGEACIDLFFFSVCGSVNLSWGESTLAILPQKPVLPDLTAALQDARNWSAALPDGTTQAVTLSSPKPDDKTLRVHPMGTLTVRETVVPLDLPITRYANGTPADGNYFAISNAQIDGQEETTHSITEYFAAGQFLTLSDADKVSRPSFERYDAGVTIGSASLTNGADSPRTVVYEERYIDVPSAPSRFSRRYLMTADVHMALSRQGAGFASPLKNTGLFKYRNGISAPAIKTQDPSYVVTQMDDLSMRSDIVSSDGKTYFHSRAALDAHLALHPEEADNLQIMPLHEVAA